MKLYNTPLKSKQEFDALNPPDISIYTCGPTVYDYPHIGNWTGYIYWDVLIRLLEKNGFNVRRVINITDVGHLTSDADEGEDKLEKGAQREGKTAFEVAEFYTKDFIEGMKKLNLIWPQVIAKATEYIPEQIDLIKKLEEKGFVYQISDGVYFDTSKFTSYPDFAHLNLDQLKAGARVEVNTEKRNQSDFALWKFSPQNQKRDMEWPSPWGVGFPGWHLECSAMAMKLLGETLDIHTGGIDHIPVHHTNEIAQSEAASGKPFSRFWLHNNHLKINGTKISKSLSNYVKLQELLDKQYSVDDFRLFVLQSHYRTEGNFTWEGMEAAKNRFDHWKRVAVLRFQQDLALPQNVDSEIQSQKDKILKSLDDDLNTPAALTLIDETFTKFENGNISISDIEDFIKYIDNLLGFQLLENSKDISSEQKELISSRQTARSQENWSESDRLRDELHTAGIGLNDVPQGSIWYRSNVIQ